MRFIFSILVILSFSSLMLSQDLNFTSDYVPGDIGVFQPVTVTQTDDAGQWCPSGTFPNLPAATYFQASAWLGDTLYVQTPSSAGAGATTVLKYTMGGTWTTGVPLPVTRTGGTLNACNGKLYYVGGAATGINVDATNNVYEYTPSTGTWVAKAPLPIALSAHRTVTWGDSVLFVVGGPYTGSGTNLNVHYYRVATNTWGTITNSLPSGQGRRTFACDLVNNKIIVAAGYNTVFLKSVYIGVLGSDATQLTWHAGPAVPTIYTGLSRPGGIGLGDYFFIVNGERAGAGGYYDTTHVFNVNSETWVDIINNKPVKMSNIFSGVAAKAFNDSIKIFVPGGYGSLTGATPGIAYAVFDVVGCGNLLLIPVELVYFRSVQNGSNVELSWATSTETNNSGFEIFRTYNNSVSEKIGFVEGNGTTSETHVYTFSDNNLKNGTYSYNLVQIDLDGTRQYSDVINVTVDNQPSDFSLMQNYPNPFNPQTKIGYTVPAKAHVSLKVFDVLGNEVCQIINETQDAGQYEIAFDTQDYNLSSGVYFYTLTSGNFSSTKKMVLVR